ncbi:hypothetical protein [Undibacterium sp. TC9W]|uniref:hypothetical protein n=1 Tax=Undibacterium sp. TC9W TaxID=3413053 RepID=UPI003BF1A0F8
MLDLTPHPVFYFDARFHYRPLLLKPAQERLAARYRLPGWKCMNVRPDHSPVGKDGNRRTLSAIIGILKQAHPDMKSFSFPKIEAILSSAGQISKF